MKAVLYIAGITLISLLSACAKPESSDQDLSGRYIGIFNRTGMDTVQVSLEFDGNHFTGHSNRTNYPAICNGTFELTGNGILFNDSCDRKADFDWSLALSGQYSIAFHPGSIRIWNTHGGVTDEYLLREPLR